MLGVRPADISLEAKYGKALAADFKTLLGEVDSRQVRPSAREVDRVSADAAPDLKYALIAPALKIGERGDVRFD